MKQAQKHQNFNVLKLILTAYHTLQGPAAHFSCAKRRAKNTSNKAQQNPEVSETGTLLIWKG